MPPEVLQKAVEAHAFVGEEVTRLERVYDSVDDPGVPVLQEGHETRRLLGFSLAGGEVGIRDELQVEVIDSGGISVGLVVYCPRGGGLVEVERPSGERDRCKVEQESRAAWQADACRGVIRVRWSGEWSPPVATEWFSV